MRNDPSPSRSHELSESPVGMREQGPPRRGRRRWLCVPHTSWKSPPAARALSPVAKEARPELTQRRERQDVGGTHGSRGRGVFRPPHLHRVRSLKPPLLSHADGKPCGSSTFVCSTSLPVWWPPGQPAWQRTWGLPLHQGGSPREKVSAQTSPPPTAGRERGARRKACLMWAPRVLPFPRVAGAE